MSVIRSGPLLSSACSRWRRCRCWCAPLFPDAEKYYLHLLIQILLWSFIYTGWSLMGRFGLTSLGHGAFTGIGAYVTVMLWNFAGLTPVARHTHLDRAGGPSSAC